MARDYSSIYNIKDYAVSTVAPKYFNMEEVNDLNIGALGYITELLSTFVEDGFNTTTTYLNEIFPNKAILPETIYTNAAMFQEGNIFAKPAEMMAWLFISEEDILRYSNIVDDVGTTSSQKEFFVDSDMLIDVEGIPFMLDYDIRISYVQPNTRTILYNAAYNKIRHNTTYKSSLDTDNSHYIKSRVITYNNENFLAMYVKLRQVERATVRETVIMNDVINAPFFNVKFDGDISSFEVFCKQPDENEYVQLTTRLVGSAPLKDKPFCYYRMSDENEFEISFSVKDGFYKPEFGAEVIIDYTTTLGKAGEFELYTGEDIICTGKSDVYEYNNKLIVFCITQSPSQFAEDKMSLDDLKIRNIENMSTVMSYTTENDLNLYFSRFANSDSIKLYTIKKRNDYNDRLFTTYSMYRGSDGNIIKTNTLDINIQTIQGEDGSFVNSFDRFIPVEGTTSLFIPTGSVFKYDDSGKRVLLTDKNINELTPEDTDNTFVFTNPFLIYLTRNPSIIGYYLNTVNASYTMDYSEVNNGSFIQFMCNTFTVKRNAIIGTDEETHRYRVQISITPTTDVSIINTEDTDVYNIFAIDGDASYLIGSFNRDTGLPVGDLSDSTLKANLTFNRNGSGAHIPLTITHYDQVGKIFTLECDIVTDDYITTNQFRVKNAINEEGIIIEPGHMVDMDNSIISVSLFIKTETGDKLTNRYTSMEPHVTFIKPLNMCKSNVRYNKASAIEGVQLPSDPTEAETMSSMVDTFIDTAPFVGVSMFTDPVKLEEFFKMYTEQYAYIEDVLDNITNNYGVDLKFYNTYGHSKNFIVEDGTNINSVNIRIEFRIKPVHGTDEATFINDVKYFIKDYIENVNESNENAIYISNLITELETKFSAIKYIKFDTIIGVPHKDGDLTTSQTVENVTVETDKLSPAELRAYVPEYLTIDVDDVGITII